MIQWCRLFIHLYTLSWCDNLHVSFRYLVVNKLSASDQGPEPTCWSSRDFFLSAMSSYRGMKNSDCNPTKQWVGIKRVQITRHWMDVLEMANTRGIRSEKYESLAEERGEERGEERRGEERRGERREERGERRTTYLECCKQTVHTFFHKILQAVCL